MFNIRRPPEIGRKGAGLRVGLLAATAFFALYLGTGACERPGKRSGEPEIRALLDRQVEAWNRHDLEGFMQGYWSSPDLTFFSNTTVTSGWQSTLERYRKRYQSEGAEMGKLEFLDLKVEMMGERAAFVRGRYRLKMTSNESGGLFTLIVKKMGEDWRIVHDHTSS
jgi:beta-aspartyl-peptidase (threonine type)